MDTGSKSLAQLSEEGKEKKYVTIEVGSKVSGYTKDYLERLCRLNKVEYCLRGNGSFAIELESLLSETHTILLSYEGITFIEKSELTEPVSLTEDKNSSSRSEKIDAHAETMLLNEETISRVEVPILNKNNFSQSIPQFSGVNHLSQQTHGGGMVSFVGRSVVSDGIMSEMSTEKEKHISVVVGDESLPVAVPFKAPPTHTSTTSDGSNSSFEEATSGSQPLPDHEAVFENSSPLPIQDSIHIPILLSRDQTAPISSPSTPPSPKLLPIAILPIAPQGGVKIEFKQESTLKKLVSDDWDDLLFNRGSLSSVDISDTPQTLSVSDQQAEVSTPSEIAVQKDVESPSQTHHEVQPNEALIVSSDIVSSYRPIKTSLDASEHHDEGLLFPPLSKESRSSFVPPPGQKVIVFDPQTFTHDPATTKSTGSRVVAPSSFPIQSSIIPRAIPRVILPTTDASSSSELSASVPSVLPTVHTESLPAYSMNTGISERTPLPVMRVMPQLPMLSNEQHLLLRDERPLMVSKMLVVFGFFVGSASLLLLGGLVSGKFGIDLNSASYVASVGAIDETRKVVPSAEASRQAPSEELLPFSNDIVVSTSTTPGLVNVTPVFKDGKGTTYQYEIVSPDSPSSSAASVSN